MQIYLHIWRGPPSVHLTPQYTFYKLYKFLKMGSTLVFVNVMLIFRAKYQEQYQKSDSLIWIQCPLVKNTAKNCCDVFIKEHWMFSEVTASTNHIASCSIHKHTRESWISKICLRHSAIFGDSSFWPNNFAGCFSAITILLTKQDEN